MARHQRELGMRAEMDKSFSVKVDLTLLKIHFCGNSLAIQWLGLGTFSARVRVQSSVGDLRPHKLPNMAQPKKLIIKFLKI